LYKAIPGKNVDYKKAPPIEGSFDHFDIRLEKGEVVFKLKTHFPTVEKARAITDNFINRWEIVTGLQQNPGDLRFIYASADIIDLEPDEFDGVTSNLNVTLSDVVLVSEAVTIQIGRGEYPSLPPDFAISPDLEVLYQRYKAFRENRESLTSMAYFCLTVLEHRFTRGRKRKEAANLYKIEDKILDMIGQLSSRKGAVSDARKYPESGSFSPMSSQERTWLDAAIKRLILRVGEHDFDPSADLPIITMDDLPPLR